MEDAPQRPATEADFLAIPEGERFHELIGGELVRKATPSAEHGDAQAGVVSPVRARYHGPPRDGGGGWRIATEVEVRLEGGDLVRPDVLGWRRTTCPERPVGSPVGIRPDWTCEVISPSRPNDDTVKKLRLYHAARVPHYWLVDPRDSTLTVMRWAEPGYVMVLRAERGEVVSPEPFEEIELHVGSLFGDDPPA
ncbi:MAG: Uma2 family endonuclease [Myxococcales bacterium]|nr:Uma2 family endonuclease [Myxococcales bacterium]